MDYRRHYQHWHDGSEQDWSGSCQSQRLLLSALVPAGHGRRLVDIGCGAGFCLRAALDLGYSEAVGIDTDLAQIAAARRRGLDAIRVDPGDDAFYATHAGRFDVATMLDVLEHIPRAQQVEALRRTASLLRPGGLLVVQVPNCASPVAAYMRDIDWTHEVSFSQFGLDYVLHHAGFVEIVVGPTPMPAPTALRERVRQVPFRMANALVTFLWRFTLASAVGRRDARRLHLTPNIVATARVPMGEEVSASTHA
jgi:SAM-dependent methyltransferase